MQRYKFFFYRKKNCIQEKQQGVSYCLKKGAFLSLLQLPFLSSMPISPSRPRKFGEHATKNASRIPCFFQ